MATYILPFSRMVLTDIPKVGGKNASLGEMITTLASKNINVPEGFALTADAYWLFITENSLKEKLTSVLATLDTKELSNLHEVGEACRNLVSGAELPGAIKQELLDAYHGMSGAEEMSVAVRSSATAEDLPTASFAGQHDSFLNIKGDSALRDAVHKCYVSLFNDRAIKYRVDNGFEHMDVALSIGIQRMVRSDKASAGVAFTIEPESGNRNLVYITGAWGLGEAVVQGAVNPDEYYFFKPAIENGKESMVSRRLGAKKNMMVYSDVAAEVPVKTIATSAEQQARFTLTREEAKQLAAWCYDIEQHYRQPMDIEWAKDGLDNKLYILQARPETVHGREQKLVIKEYKIKTDAEPLCKGKAVGKSVVTGKARIITSLAEADKVEQGDIIVADITNPDWNALLKKAVSIVTNKGGRTSHASIVARELGIPAVVGTGNATKALKDGQEITVSCAGGDAGFVYAGTLKWELKEWDLEKLSGTHTQAMYILADPDKALSLAAYPNNGVGLMRMEFAINNKVLVHPMALVKFDELPASPEKERITLLCEGYTDKKQYFVDTLAESIAMVAAAFYPKDVIVRMSDFKTNEYARLLGGQQFEPEEENPMLGFRGASRYYNERYKAAFGLECLAMKKVRDEMSLTNVKLMIPFCRTVDEGVRVLETMKEYGLERGKNDLEVYVMAEIPSNVLLAKEFAEVFDGFSIGSNDLTQLTLGLDRDSAIVSDLFDENNEAVRMMLRQVISEAKHAGSKIGLCGQAPSDFPEFAQFLVEQGIDSISFNPDALARGMENIAKAEEQLQTKNNWHVVAQM